MEEDNLLPPPLMHHHWGWNVIDDYPYARFYDELLARANFPGHFLDDKRIFRRQYDELKELVMKKHKVSKDSWKEYEEGYVRGAYVMCISDEEDPYGADGHEVSDGVVGEIYQIVRTDRYSKNEAPMICINPNKTWWVSAYRFRPVSITSY